jgi:hypothetical protein
VRTMMSRWLAVVIALGTAAPAFAQNKIIPGDDTLKGGDDKDIEGWNTALAGTATVNLVSNSNVVGQTDGFSTLVGLGLIAGADYVQGKHVVRNTLTIAESVARTPVIAEFVKTNDVVQLEGLYNYFAVERFGGFGRLALQTGIFPANDVRGEPTSWVVKPVMAGDPPEMLATGAFRQRLADPLAPFTINESVGGFAEPIHGAALSLSARAGVGGRHTFAGGVLVSDDDKATPEIELVRLSSVHQLGLEGFAGAQGKLKDGKFTYHAGLTVLVPAINNDKFDRSAGDLTRIGFEGALTMTVFDWMSVVYSVSIVRDAQLFPKGNELTQVQNSLLLTLTYTFVKRREKTKEETAADSELAAAKARADLADKARIDAETRALDLQRRLDACNAGTCAPAVPPLTPAPDPAAPAPNPAQAPG